MRWGRADVRVLRKRRKDMGLFDKKYCDICGEKIKLLGNRKLEDGNLCKNCASKLSPWFSERRHSTVADIKEQLAYREANAAEVAKFHTTRSLGRYTKLLLDEDSRKFMVTGAKDIGSANPDVLDYAQVTGCDLDIDEDRDEIMQKTGDGHETSYTPPRYEYSYQFYVTIYVNHPYFDQMRFQLSNGSVRTGEQSMAGTPGGWTVQERHSKSGHGANDYDEYVAMGNEIKEAVMQMRQDVRDEIATAAAPKTAVTCPACGATTVPDASGCCEYCGASVRG